MEDIQLQLQLLEQSLEVQESTETFLETFKRAVREKHELYIQFLISEKGVLQRHFTEDHVSLLHIIARQGTVETAARMLKLGSDVNFRNSHGETPIFSAIKHSAEMVKLLIRNGATVNISCKREVTPLHEALLAGSEETVQTILNTIFADKQKHANASNPEYFRGPITVHNSEETIRSLLNYKADLCLKVRDYPLLIFFSAKTGNKDLLKLTLEDCRKYLDSHKSRRQQSRWKTVNAPQELNFPGYFDRTALHYATKQQLQETVRFLLEAGADVNCKTNEGYTPIHYAVVLENYAICKILFRSGAKVDMFFPSRQPNLDQTEAKLRNCLNSSEGYHYEEYHNSKLRMRTIIGPTTEFSTIKLKIMKLFLQNKADPDYGRIDGMPTLLEACESGNLEAVKLLLEFGADIRVCNFGMNSALHCSIQSAMNLPFLSMKENYFELVEYVIDHGVDVNKINVLGQTALHYALGPYLHGDSRVIECLLESGADFKLRIIRGGHDSNMPDIRDLGLEKCRKYLLAFIALQEDTLGDYIQDYISNEDGMINKAQEYFLKCKLELKRLKSTTITVRDVSCTLYDFLTWDIYKMSRIINNIDLWDIIIFNTRSKDFPCYACLLNSRIERLQKLGKTIDKIVDVIQSCLRNLPTLVVEKILSYFRLKDFRNFEKISSAKR